mmetsp:Transcript_33072/g.76423  ORF Transcript_33072/g.76423 Transcript_33072/m.76423 type:complete len:606 (-) Transcript_33072:115-1932(-)
MAVAAVVSRRQAAQVAGVMDTFVTRQKSSSSLRSGRSGRISPKSSKSPRSSKSAGNLDETTSKAISTVSKREVDEDEFQEILEEQGLADFREEEPVKPKLVDRTEFESVVGVLIGINALVMGFEADLGQKGDVGWIVIENFFCLLWISEMLLKFWFFRLDYFYSSWNVFDFFLVMLNIFETWVIPAMSINDLNALGVLRIVRVLRILRLLRLIRLMRLFKNLWLIIVGFRESLSTLFWVLLLLLVVIYVFAIFLRLTLDCDMQYQHWGDCPEYFGSMVRTMYTLFQVITLESWSQVFARPIINVQPAFFFVFLFFLFLTTFGILNIIVGVIVENTLNAAKQNADLQERRLQRQLRQELESIRILFEDADSDGSGTLEVEEFVEILADETIQHTLTRMEIPVEDPRTLFEILDPQSTGSISFPIFAQGVLKVKGPPTQLDMKTMQLGVAGISRRVTKVEQRIDHHSKLLEKSTQMLSQIMDRLGVKDAGGSGKRLSTDEDGHQDGHKGGQGPGPGGTGAPGGPGGPGGPGDRGDRSKEAASAEQDAIEVESIGEGEGGRVSIGKSLSNDSLELLRESATSFHSKTIDVPVPRYIKKPMQVPGQLDT